MTLPASTQAVDARGHNHPAVTEYIGPPAMQDDDRIQKLVANLVLLKSRGMDIDMFFDKKPESDGGSMTVFELSTHFTHSLNVTVTANSVPAPQCHSSATAGAAAAAGDPANGADPLTDNVRLYRASRCVLKSHVSPLDGTWGICIDSVDPRKPHLIQMKYNRAAPKPNKPKQTTSAAPDPGHVIGGAAAVHGSSSTFVTVCLPHFSAFLHIGDALVDCIAQMRRYQAEAQDRLAEDTQILSVYQSLPIHLLDIDPSERTVHAQDLATEIADAKDELADAHRFVRVLRDVHHVAVFQVLVRNARIVVLPRFSAKSLAAGADPLRDDDETDADPDSDSDLIHTAPPLSHVRRNARDLGLARFLTQLPAALARAGVHAWTVCDAFAVQQCGSCGFLNGGRSQLSGWAFRCCRCQLKFHRDENAARNMWVKFHWVLRMLGLHREVAAVDVPLARVGEVVGVRGRRE